MQRQTSHKVFLGNTVSPFEDAGRSSAIDRTASNYNDAKEKVQKIRKHIKTGRYDINCNSIQICFPVKIKKKSNTAEDTDTDMIPVNNIFAHFVKEISITKYGSDKELISTFSP